MNCSPCLSLVLLLLLSAPQAQQKTAPKPPLPPKSKAPTINCSDAETTKACTSFKQLIEAEDKDILDGLSSPTSYVCFRPNEDAFIIFHVDAPNPYGWRQSADGVVQTQEGKSSATLTEYRNGVLYTFRGDLQYWHRSGSGSEEFFHSETTEGLSKGLDITIRDVQIYVAYPFESQNGGTTEYSLAIRRSTGRFIETFESKNVPTTNHSGACLIYR